MWEQARRVVWPMAGGQAAGGCGEQCCQSEGQIVQGLGSVVESGFFKDSGKVLGGF